MEAIGYGFNRESIHSNVLNELKSNDQNQYFSTPAAQIAPEFLAQGYVYHKEKYEPVPFMNLTIVSGAGSVISNVLDYTKWIKALLSTSGPISKAGYKALLTSRSILDSGEGPSPFTGTQTYALGWFTGSYQGYEFFTHSGGMEAFGAEVIFFPKLQYGIVSLGNTASTSNSVEERLMWHLIDEKLSVPEEDRFDWNKR
jgi:CubicO group peptidase (beta-lactamase class C family)